MAQNNKQPFEEFVPRDYQLQIKDICMKKNTIVYLPTGAGKTHIALMVMREMSYQLQNTIENGGKRMFFLANTVTLAKQQAQFFSRHLPFQVRLYTSEVNVDNWKSDRWFQEFHDVQVLVSTSQILLDILRHGFITPTNINLVVFDECHHAVGQHPMHAIMKELISVRPDQRPRVIGLSGTLLFKELKAATQVPEELERLENTFNATISTAVDDNAFAHVCGFSTKPNELILPFNKDAIHTLPIAKQVLSWVHEYMKEIEIVHLPHHDTQSSRTLRKTLSKPIKEVQKALKEFEYQLLELGIFPASIAILSIIVQLEISKRQSQCEKSRYLFRKSITFADSVHRTLVTAMGGFSIQQRILRFSSDRIKKVITYLQQSYQSQEDRKKQCIVFVERRITAKILYHTLNYYFGCQEDSQEQMEQDPIIRPNFIVGKNASIVESIDQILLVSNDRRIIERFRKFQINVLCATNVLEEGIDMQMCNLVIMFDPPKSYSSYMQSKGRARMKQSTYLMMIATEKHSEFVKRAMLYHAIEARLKQELIGKTINRELPLEQDVQKELLDDLIPPFYTPLNAKLDALSSVQLLNRYCMSLPRDLFTDVKVAWERHDHKDGKTSVSIKLPLQSTVRESVNGIPTKNMKLAKQSAAFYACKKLYDAGELNMHLLPVTKAEKIQDLSDSKYFEHWRKISNESDPRLAGTSKYVRGHRICYPPETVDCTPKVDWEESYLYVIRLSTQFDGQERIEAVRSFKELYESANNFAIMTRKQLPRLAMMKLFVTLGMIRVQVDAVPVRVRLNADSGELDSLKRFHLMLFRDLLQVWKPFTVFDSEPEENGFMIVPMLNSEEIDWKLVGRFPYLRPAVETSVRARKQLQFDVERYHHCVVHPWYKNDPSQHYVVLKVRDDLRPTSAFPNEQYASFEDYFEREHHQVVTRRDDQFLIEVKNITTKLNRLHPGADTDGGSSTRSRYWEFQEILIPELVHNFEFPADYWLKATLLPSTLHRIHYLLLAEQIRLDLAKRAQIGCERCDQPEELPVDGMVVGLKPSSELDYVDDSYSEDENDESDGGNQREDPDSHISVQQLTAMLQEINISSSEAFEQIAYPWERSEQPVDVHRMLNSLTKIDLDYYTSFVNKYAEQTEAISNDVLSAITSSSNVKRAEVPLPAKMNLPAIGFGSQATIRMLSLTPANTEEVCLQQADLLQALTTNSSADVFNLERFELLGDAFLKFSVSVYVLFRHPLWHEGYLTTCKSRIVSNRNLLYCAMNYGLPGKIKVYRFDPKNDWVPPLSTVPAPIRRAMVEANESPALLYSLELTEEEVRSGVANQATIDAFLPRIEKNEKPSSSTLQSVLQQVQISDKVVADVTEALLGVCVKTVGYERSFRFLSLFGIIPADSDIPTVLRSHRFSIVDYHEHKDRIDQLLCNPDRIESILKYRFQNRSYLAQAFTHASYTSNNLTGSYQQLEFLGDAVLDFLITMYIYEHKPSMSPGKLTDLRSAIVNNVNLAGVLVRNELHRFILSESPMLTDTIGRFVDSQKSKNTEWVRLLTEESNTTMAEYVDVPKVLGDVFEALIGAVYLDCGKDLSVTWSVCYHLLHDEIATFSHSTPIQVVRQLFEHPDAHPHFGAPIVEDDVVMVILHFTNRGQRIKVVGCGKNKEDARRAAAKIALNKLK